MIIIKLLFPLIIRNNSRNDAMGMINGNTSHLHYTQPGPGPGPPRLDLGIEQIMKRPYIDTVQTLRLRHTFRSPVLKALSGWDPVP